MNEVNFNDIDLTEYEETSKKVMEKENELKTFLVEYVGEKEKPENDEVTVEMIVNTMAKDFPEFVLTVAEENWIRGYQQAMVDVEVGERLVEQEVASSEDDQQS
jgi:dGTP triphosphohydrolase